MDEIIVFRASEVDATCLFIRDVASPIVNQKSETFVPTPFADFPDVPPSYVAVAQQTALNTGAAEGTTFVFEPDRSLTDSQLLDQLKSTFNGWKSDADARYEQRRRFEKHVGRSIIP